MYQVTEVVTYRLKLEQSLSNTLKGWTIVLSSKRDPLLLIYILLQLCASWSTGPDCVDGNRRLAADILQISRYEVPHPIQTCVLGVGEIFAYCHQKRAIQRFPLPKVHFHLYFSVLTCMKCSFSVIYTEDICQYSFLMAVTNLWQRFLKIYAIIQPPCMFVFFIFRTQMLLPVSVWSSWSQSRKCKVTHWVLPVLLCLLTIYGWPLWAEVAYYVSEKPLRW